MPTIKPATTQGMNGMMVAFLVSFVFGVAAWRVLALGTAAWRVAESLFVPILDSAFALYLRLDLDSARMLFVYVLAARFARCFARRFEGKILEQITAKLAHTHNPKKYSKAYFQSL